MGVITLVTVENSEVELGGVLAAVGDLRLAFDCVVPTGTDGFKYLWAYTKSQEEFQRVSAGDPGIKEIRKVHVGETEGLYEVSLDLDADGFLWCLRESALAVLRGFGSVPRWKFELRFQNYGAVDRFQSLCREEGISYSVEEVQTDCAVSSSEETLTPVQRETIELALKWGYFKVPRQTTIVELAEELGVSDQAVSARIRRGMQTLAQQFVGSEVSAYADHTEVLKFE